MSGHSKFANIKHKKEKNEAAKGKIFTVIGREIAVAVKEGGADPANNLSLIHIFLHLNDRPLHLQKFVVYGPAAVQILVLGQICLLYTSDTWMN